MSRRGSQTDPKTTTMRNRKNSVTAADVLNRLSYASSASDGDTSLPRVSFTARRRSTLSLSSVDSAETAGSGSGTGSLSTANYATMSPPTLSAGVHPRRGRRTSSRLRRDLLFGSAAPLAPRVDNASVLSLSTSSSAYGYLSSHARFSSIPGGLPVRLPSILSPRSCINEHAVTYQGVPRPFTCHVERAKSKLGTLACPRTFPFFDLFRPCHG